MISQIKFASIPVADQQRALDFYTQKLGFKVVTDQSFGEMRWIELRIGTAQTKVVLFPLQDRPPGGFLNVVFQTDDVQKTYEELRANGVEFTQEPRTESWGTSAMRFRGERHPHGHEMKGAALLPPVSEPGAATLVYALRCLLTSAVISNIET